MREKLGQKKLEILKYSYKIYVNVRNAAETMYKVKNLLIFSLAFDLCIE